MTEQNTNTSTTQLREADNKATITGVLIEKEIRGHKPEVTDPSKQFKSAKLTIKTGEDEQVTIEMYAKKLKANNEENGLYKGLETIENEFKTVAKFGEDGADKVTTNTVKIELNDYVGGDGQLRSFPKLKNTFINRVETRIDVNEETGEEKEVIVKIGDKVLPEEKEFAYEATFSVEGVVNSVIPETDKDGEETGRVKLQLYIPVYGGKVIPFDFVVHKDGSSYVEEEYTKGATVSVHGEIVNRKKITETEKEMGFGQPEKVVKYETVREYLVMGGTPVYDEESSLSYNTEAIRQALTEREVYLDGLKAKKAQQANGNSGKPTGGFDVGSKPKNDVGFGAVDISSDDLPF